MNPATTSHSTSRPTSEPNVVRPWSLSAQITLALLVFSASGLLLWHYLQSSSSTAAPTILHEDPKIDLNRADRAELVLLPEVGPTLAERIENYRRDHGGFERVDDLLKIKGIGRTKLAQIRPWVFVEETSPDKDGSLPSVPPGPEPAPPEWTTRSKKQVDITGPININVASAEELQRLPGIGPVLSGRIVTWRDAGPFTFVDDLVKVKGIGPKTMAKIRPYVTVGN